MTTNPVTSPSAAPAAAQTQAQQAAAAASPLANEDVFLQLLVAQLKYQDPDNPPDGTAFVTQLAQFSSLEQETQSATDLNAINTVVQSFALPAASTSAAPPAAGTDPVTGAPTGTNSTPNS
jgi:flagellar basal-body rod modification protein FlgD